MKSKKILLVDDSQPFNFLSRVTIQKTIDCNVTEALNGKEALNAIVKGDCPDIILLDLNMPVMDGFEFLKEFEKKSKCVNHTKIYILTSSTLEEDKVACMAHKSVKGYFDKPLLPEHLNKIVADFKVAR